MPQSTVNSMVQQRHEIKIKNANNANKCKIITQKFLTQFMDLSFGYHEQTHSVCSARVHDYTYMWSNNTASQMLVVKTMRF